MFRSEVDAYRIVNSRANLCEQVAQFYGMVTVADVKDNNGASIRERFCLTAATLRSLFQDKTKSCVRGRCTNGLITYLSS